MTEEMFFLQALILSYYNINMIMLYFSNRRMFSVQSASYSSGGLEAIMEYQARWSCKHFTLDSEHSSETGEAVRMLEL